MLNLKWMCLTPLQVNESMHSWERIKNHILGIWNHSDFSIDISKLHQNIQDMKQVESHFSSQWLSNSLFKNLEGNLSHGSFSTIMINVAMCLYLLVLICVIAPCLFRILSRNISALSTEFHTYALKNKKGGDVGSRVRHYWQNGGTAPSPVSSFCRHRPGIKELGLVILTCLFLSSTELTEKEY